MDAPKRKTPRLNPTSAVLKHAARFGFNVRVCVKPDGTTEYDLQKPSTGAEAENEKALTGAEAHAHIERAIATIRKGGHRGGKV